MKKLSIKRIWISYKRAYCGAPALLSLLVVVIVLAIVGWQKFTFNPVGLGILTNCLSIFGALLFGLIVPVFDQASRYNEAYKKALDDLAEKKASVDDDAVVKLLRLKLKVSLEVFSLIFFTIVLAFGTVIFSLVLGQFPINKNNVFEESVATKVLTYIVTTLCVWCFSHIAMLLRGLFSTFAEEALDGTA